MTNATTTHAHEECIYRVLAGMATNYADTLREVRLGLTDVKIETLIVPTYENALAWVHEYGYCNEED